jgi:predicted alpha/beta-hydrolase family hydrolase
MRDEHLYALERPMLFISGTRDAFAERDLLQGVVDRLRQRATLVWIEGGDHSLKSSRNDKTSIQSAANSIERWIKAL